MSKRNPEITKDQFISFKPDVIYQRFDEKAILVNLKSEEIYELNETGTQIAELIGQGVTIGGLVSSLKEQYPGASPEIDNDVNKLIEELADKRLVILSPPITQEKGSSHDA